MISYDDAVFKTQIIQDYTIRIVVDDVSENGTEYRSSIYDDQLDLIAEGWGQTPELATKQAMGDL